MLLFGLSRFVLQFPIPPTSFFRPLGAVPNTPSASGITVTMFHNFLNSLAKYILSIFLLSLVFLSVVSRKSKIHYEEISLVFFLFFFFFSVDYHKTRSSCRHEGICLYLKIPENFMSLILRDILWFMYMPFGSMVKHRLFAQFPVDHLSQTVVGCLILLLLLFATSFVIIILLIRKFFTPTLADGFPLESA